MTVEMAGQRALVPHFGSSTYVWTNLIGLLLAALAVGYLLGGRIADRWPRPQILLVFVAVAGLICLLIPLVVRPLGGAMIPEGTRLESAFRVVYLGSFLLTLLLFVPPILLLGMVTPFIIRLMTRETQEVGRSSGRVYALSTVGSILGTFFPTLVLIPWRGTSTTFFLAAGTLILFSVAGLLLFSTLRRGKTAALLLIPLLPAAFFLSRSVKGGKDTLAEVESRVQYIRVFKKGEAIVLALNEELETYHSLLHPGRALTASSHFDYFLTLPFHFDPVLHPRLRIYIAGLAAGIMSRQIHHFFGETYRLEIDGAEIDEAVLEMGRQYFGLEGAGNRNLKAYAMDARLFLEKSDGSYDLILVDAYANQMYIPFQLASREFFRLTRERLAPGGIVCINAVDFRADGALLATVRNTMADVFPTVEQYKVPGGMNYILYAGRDGVLSEDTVRVNLGRASFLSRPEAETLSELAYYGLEAHRAFHRDPGGIVLTDDHSPIEALMDASFRRARRRSAKEDWQEP
jgi:spermidine synthase